VNTLENNIVSFETIPRKDVKKGKGGIEWLLNVINIF
jgi:hypothetical protein